MYVDSNGFSLLRSLVGNRMYNTAGIVSHIDIALVPRPLPPVTLSSLSLTALKRALIGAYYGAEAPINTARIGRLHGFLYSPSEIW